MSFDLFLWNNNLNAKEQVTTICNNHKLNSQIKINIKHHKQNIGGVGRFRLPTYNRALDNYPFLLFIDDDQDFGPSLIKDCKSFAVKGTLKAWWSWKIFKNNYGKRVRVNRPNQQADYCGTGGMLVESSIFKDGKIIEGLPPRFSFIEDLWLTSYCKYVLKMKCEHLPIDIKLKNDGKNQYQVKNAKSPASIHNKQKFYTYLTKQFNIKPK